MQLNKRLPIVFVYNMNENIAVTSSLALWTNDWGSSLLSG